MTAAALRWLLFDLVVGATLVWLVWTPGSSEPPAVASASVAPLPIAPGPAEPRCGPAMPLADVPPAMGPATAVETPDEPGYSSGGRLDPAPAGPAADRGRRLRALAREAETLFLRGRE